MVTGLISESKAEMWRAVEERDTTSDGKFVFAVLTTGFTAAHRVPEGDRRRKTWHFTPPRGRQRRQVSVRAFDASPGRPTPTVGVGEKGLRREPRLAPNSMPQGRGKERRSARLQVGPQAQEDASRGRKIRAQ